MSSGTVRKLSLEDIQLVSRKRRVQNLIERCLQLYMNQKEVVDTLLEQAKIDPGFTELVWQKLEEQNQEFFKAYYLRLMVKQQIMEFNKLLEQQVQLMQQMQSSGASALPTSNGTHMPTLPQNPACYAAGPALSAGNIRHPIASGLTNAFTNGGPPLPKSLHTAIHMSAHASRMDAPPNMLSSQTSNMGGLVPGINGGMIKTEAGYSGASPYMFGSDHNVLEARPPIGEASVASFSSVDSTSQPIGEAILDADTSFGFLGQIPRNFSLSDLTADFSQSSGLSDILESYPRSPFLATDAENFLDSRERGEQGDNRRLDPISESLNYGDFGSE